MPEELKVEISNEEVKIETSETTLKEEQPSEQTTTTKEAEKSELDILKEKIAQVEQERDMFKDQLYRKAADYENFRRQKEREAAALLKFAEEGIIKKLLPTLDDLERVIKNADKFLAGNPDAKIYVDGVKLIQQKLLKTLEERGVKKIESVGKKFDVNYHEALTQQPTNDVEPETIVEEFESGYMLHDKVIRHAKVVVAKEIETQPEKSE
jgi:molecular chaperone GrpE